MTLPIPPQTSVTFPGPRLHWPLERTYDPYTDQAAVSVRPLLIDPGLARVLSPKQTQDVKQALIGELKRAIALASDNRLDLPSRASAERAGQLLSSLALAVDDPSVIEVFVADDGTIEITASPPNKFVTIDVAPSTARVEVFVQDAQRRTIWSSPNVSIEEVTRQLELAS